MKPGSLIDALRLATEIRPAIRSFISKTSGKKHGLLLELQTNVDLVRNFFREDLPVNRVIEKLSKEKLEQAVEDGYNFDRWVGGGKVRQETVGDARQLQAYVGRRTSNLFRQVLRRIRELQTLVEIDPDNPKVRKSVRLSNLLKLMLLLLRHVAK